MAGRLVARLNRGLRLRKPPQDHSGSVASVPRISLSAMILPLRNHDDPGEYPGCIGPRIAAIHVRTDGRRPAAEAMDLYARRRGPSRRHEPRPGDRYREGRREAPGSLEPARAEVARSRDDAAPTDRPCRSVKSRRSRQPRPRSAGHGPVDRGGPCPAVKRRKSGRRGTTDKQGLCSLASEFGGCGALDACCSTPAGLEVEPGMRE